MDALIGYTGFVGSYLIRPNMDVYRSTTIDDIRNKTYTTIYCAGLPAEKWKANQCPEQDYANMKRLMDALSTVTCTTFVLISTVDVLYDHPYGRHRRMMEEWCIQTFPRVYVFRLPALFGHGLKKNALYDMLHKNQIDKLRSHWTFQWYCLDWLVDDIRFYLAEEPFIVNLVTPPISLQTIQSLFFPDLSLRDTQDIQISYAIPGVSHSREDVLAAMARYIHFQPRYLVSEIGWTPNQSDVMLSFLQSRGIRQEEIVPSKRHWDMSAYKHAYSCQSLLYGLSIQIFQEQERFLDILRERVNALQSVGVSVVIFGSPKQRMYSGEDAISLFRKVGEICSPAGILFCIENNARAYGGNWLHTFKEVDAFVKEVNHPNICINLDTGSMLMEEETDISDISNVRHVQVSFPNLGHWDVSYEPMLSHFLCQLQAYTGHFSLEMLNVTPSDIDAFMRIMNPR